MVGSAPGLCVVQSGTQTFLVQATEDGLLIAATNSGAEDVGGPNLDGTAPLNIYNRDAAIIFCSPDLLDPSSGAPTRDCLTSLDTMSAGPGALVGSGRLFVSAVVDEAGSARCPASVAVLASVRTPGGDDLELTSSFGLSPVVVSADAAGPRAPLCEVSRRRVALAYRGGAGPVRSRGSAGEVGPGSVSREEASNSVATELRWLRELSDDDWRVVTELVRLDDQEWDVLHRLLSLDANQAGALEARLQADGVAVLTDAGTVAPVAGSDSGASGTVVTTDAVEGILDDILARVNSILSTVGSISDRVPNRPDIRALIADGNFAARVGMVIQRVRELLDGVLAVAATMREGFDGWYGTGCDQSSRCAAFKADLNALFSDVGDASELVQALSCLDQPGLPIRRPDLSLMQTLVVDNSPPVLLFSLYKVLERIDPGDVGQGGWRSMIRDVLAEIPADFQNQLRALCGHVGDLPEVGGSSGVKCSILRPEEVGLALAGARAVSYRKEQVAKFIDGFFKDDVVAEGDLVAGGGGGGGTNVKSPPKVVSKRATDIAESLTDKIGDYIDARNDCIQADADIESDLRDCQPPISVLLQGLTDSLPPHPTFNDVTSVVRLRLYQVQDCQRQGLCAGLNVANARSYLDAAGRVAGTVAGYTDLCCAYQALNGGSQISCPLH